MSDAFERTKASAKAADEMRLGVGMGLYADDDNLQRRKPRDKPIL